MNHGDDDNSDDYVDEDYDVKGNDDDDDNDEFFRLDDGDDMYYVPSQDVRRSQTNAYNNEVECNVRRHGSIDIRTYTSHIHNSNTF